MRTLAKILRTIGRRLSWPAEDYAAPRGLGPRHYYYFHYYYYFPHPSRTAERR